MAQNYRALLKDMPKDVMGLRPLRLGFLLIQTIVGLTAVALIVGTDFALPWKIVLSLIVGHCWGMNGFASHEILHGSVVRNKTLQDVLAFFAFLPFLISPTFWRYWHNTQHHTHTQKLLQDPDAYPTYRIFKHSKFMQWLFPMTPGSGHKRSALYLFLWFSVNVIIAQVYFRFRNNMFEKLNHKRVNFELALAAVIAVVYLYLVGPSNWFLACVIPFLVQNYLVFSYISTNHNLSPLNKENDPLYNSLTVTNHPILEFLHLNFGYHVEHHLFPTMSPANAKYVHAALKKNYPDTFQVMPKWKALVQLYRTPRVYKNLTELIHPETLEVFPTIGAKKGQSIETTEDTVDEETSPTEVTSTDNVSMSSPNLIAQS